MFPNEHNSINTQSKASVHKQRGKPTDSHIPSLSSSLHLRKRVRKRLTLTRQLTTILKKKSFSFYSLCLSTSLCTLLCCVVMMMARGVASHTDFLSDSPLASRVDWIWWRRSWAYYHFSSHSCYQGNIKLYSTTDVNESLITCREREKGAPKANKNAVKHSSRFQLMIISISVRSVV